MTVACADCGWPISLSAETCPHCGMRYKDDGEYKEYPCYICGPKQRLTPGEEYYFDSDCPACRGNGIKDRLLGNQEDCPECRRLGIVSVDYRHTTKLGWFRSITVEEQKLVRCRRCNGKGRIEKS